MTINLPYQQIDNNSNTKYVKKKLIFICLSLQFVLILLYLNYYFIYTSNGMENLKTLKRKIIDSVLKNNGYCYDEAVTDEASNEYLEKLDVSSVKESSIFFIETRCHSVTANILTKRQACAVESAANTNPDMSVYVLFPSAVPFKAADVEPYVQQLLKYPNVKLRYISMAEYMERTPLESWYGQGALKTSKFPLVHISDVLRLVTIWKFGGIYLDLDTVTLKSLNGLVPFAAIANTDYIGNAAIGSPSKGIGHYVVTLILKALKEHFQGDQWGINGPILLTEVLRKVCQLEPDELITEMNKERCNGFNIYPGLYFHPLPYYSWELYFSNGSNAVETMAAVNNSYTVHVWNKMSSERPVIVDSDQPYSLLAKRFCPLVYWSFGTSF